MSYKVPERIGYIIIECKCGADLFCFGGNHSDMGHTILIERFKEDLQPGNYGFFQRCGNDLGSCPYCQQMYQLPNSETLNWLGDAKEHDKTIWAKFIQGSLNFAKSTFNLN